jgi:hypothetical protein
VYCVQWKDNNKLVDYFDSLPVLSSSVIENSEIEEADSLPKSHKMFAKSSLRGLHVYDALVKPGGKGKKYFKIFSPVQPLTATNLPNDVREILRLTIWKLCILHFIYPVVHTTNLPDTPGIH